MTLVKVERTSIKEALLDLLSRSDQSRWLVFSVAFFSKALWKINFLIKMSRCAIFLI